MLVVQVLSRLSKEDFLSSYVAFVRLYRYSKAVKLHKRKRYDGIYQKLKKLFFTDKAMNRNYT